MNNNYTQHLDNPTPNRTYIHASSNFNSQMPYTIITTGQQLQNQQAQIQQAQIQQAQLQQQQQQVQQAQVQQAQVQQAQVQQVQAQQAHHNTSSVVSSISARNSQQVHVQNIQNVSHPHIQAVNINTQQNNLLTASSERSNNLSQNSSSSIKLQQVQQTHAVTHNSIKSPISRTNNVISPSISSHYEEFKREGTATPLSVRDKHNSLANAQQNEHHSLNSSQISQNSQISQINSSSNQAQNTQAQNTSSTQGPLAPLNISHLLERILLKVDSSNQKNELLSAKLDTIVQTQREICIRQEGIERKSETLNEKIEIAEAKYNNLSGLVEKFQSEQSSRKEVVNADDGSKSKIEKMLGEISTTGIQQNRVIKRRVGIFFLWKFLRALRRKKIWKKF